MKSAIFVYCATFIAVCCVSCAWASSSLASSDNHGDRYDEVGCNPSCASLQESECDLTVVGSVRIADGLGKQSVDLIESLKDSMRISYVPNLPLAHEELNQCSPAVQSVLQTSGLTCPGKVLILEDALTSYPTNFIPKGNFWSRFKLPEHADYQLRFAYTMFESSRIPKEWAYILNHSFDAALVPDKFLVQVYRDSGVTIPIFVLPLGRDLSCYLAYPLKRFRGHPFVFANFSTCIPRKNLLTLVRAFRRAFGHNPNVRLKLCWRNVNHDLQARIGSEIASHKLRNVQAKSRTLNEKEYFQRFTKVDCYVSISTAEGFSIQPRESMALGIPTIVTNNTGQKTICSSGLVKAVPSAKKIPAVHFFPGDFGMQYQCQVRDVAAALVDVYEHYDQYLKNSRKARQWASQYQRERLAWMYMSLIKPTTVILGRENKIEKDRIITTSQALVEKYNKIFPSTREHE